ncbi:MAG: hypothetical protein AAGC61_02005 [Microbacterium sp.]
MEALPSNSSITIDGVTINTNGGAVLLWENVIRRALTDGKPGWVRLRDGGGTRSILVHSGTSISTYFSDTDVTVNGEKFISDELPDWNLAGWVSDYIDPEDSLWPIVQSLGIDKQIAANEAADEPGV